MPVRKKTIVSHRTLADIELAKVYFEILVELARNANRQTVEYGQLVETAQAKHPDNPYVQGAIATNIGRRLETLRDFATLQGLPDLSALAVNKRTGDNGGIFKRSFDGITVREQIANFDWNSTKPSFENFLATEKETVLMRDALARPRKKFKEQEALDILWEHYKTNRSDVGAVTPSEKGKVVELIMQGLDPAQAIEQVRFDR